VERTSGGRELPLLKSSAFHGAFFGNYEPRAHARTINDAVPSIAAA